MLQVLPSMMTAISGSWLSICVIAPFSPARWNVGNYIGLIYVSPTMKNLVVRFGHMGVQAKVCQMPRKTGKTRWWGHGKTHSNVTNWSDQNGGHRWSGLPSSRTLPPRPLPNQAIHPQSWTPGHSVGRIVTVTLYGNMCIYIYMYISAIVIY